MVTPREVMPAVLAAAPGLRAALDRWHSARPPGDDGLADELAVAAAHLADAGAGDLPAVAAVADRCLMAGDPGIRSAVCFGLVLELWRRTGGSAAVGAALPPYCRAVWDRCPEVHAGLTEAVGRMLARAEPSP
jgi:hypothetical protein